MTVFIIAFSTLNNKTIKLKIAERSRINNPSKIQIPSIDWPQGLD